MQESFAFAATDVARWQALLGPVRLPVTRRGALGQLVKSSISGRTRDAVSLAAYRRLTARWPTGEALAAASPDLVSSVIADVTFAEAKAHNLLAALRSIGASIGGSHSTISPSVRSTTRSPGLSACRAWRARSRRRR